MKLDFSQEDITLLAKALAPEVAKELKVLFKPQTQWEKIMGVKELAEYLGQKPSWVYDHIHEIPHVKKGGLLMFKKSAIDKWLAPSNYLTSLDHLTLVRGGKI